MEELNLKELIQYLFSKTIPILLITIVVAGLGCFYSLFVQKPMYRSSTTMVLVHSTTDGNQAISQDDININQKLISTYREIMKSRLVMNKVITNLKLDTDYNTLSQLIGVDSVSGTELIKISVVNLDPTLAKNIANEIAQVFIIEISNIYKIQNVNIIDRASTPKQPYNMSTVKYAVLYTTIGLTIALGIFFVRHYFDTSLKTVDEIDKKLNLPILGTIPLRKEKKGRK